MGVVLATTVQMDGKVYEEGTEVNKVPVKVRKYAKENGFLVAVVDPEDLEELEEEEPEDEEDDDEEDEEDTEE